MDPNQLTTVLLNCQSPDLNTRQIAEKWVKDLEAHNLSLFLQLLCTELANNEKPAESRRLAGLILKNSLTAKDEARHAQLTQNWLNLEPNVRAGIKQSTLATLNAAAREARATAAQVVAQIAYIELPKGTWPELIQTLLTNMDDTNEHLKQATLETLGYICEEIDSEVLTQQANQILTAVCKGIKEPNHEINLAACNAMYNAL